MPVHAPVDAPIDAPIDAPVHAAYRKRFPQPAAAPACAHAAAADEGFLLVAVIVMTFLMLLALSVAAPRMATALKRERELESQRRANQYVVGIRKYYNKLKAYPPSLEALKKSNNQRFLRQEYIDPLTGQSDWRLIHVGENKTKVKGFFGEDLPGLPPVGSGFNSSGFGGSATNAPGSPGTSSTFGGNSNNGSNGGTPSPGGSGTGSGSQTGTGIGGGIRSQDATTFGGGGGGPIMGVGTSKSGESLLVVNEKTNYEEWEFLYDPRIELLKQKAALQNGIPTGGSGGGFGSSPGGFNNPGNSPASPTNPTGNPGGSGGNSNRP